MLIIPRGEYDPNKHIAEGDLVSIDWHDNSLDVGIVLKVAIEIRNAPGQLCKAFKSYDKIYQKVNSVDALVNYELSPDDIILITKSEYNEELSSYFVEFMYYGKIYYCNFYEQIVFFEDDGDAILKKAKPISSFEFPWVMCD